MTLYIFLLVIVSLLCGSAPGIADPSPRAVMASVLLVGGWVVLAHVAARLLARQVIGGSLSYGDALDYLRVQMETFRWFALPITLLCHYGFSLASWLRMQPVLEDSMALQSIGLLLPGMTLLAATWSAEFWFAAMIGVQSRDLKNYGGSIVRMMRSGPAWLVLPTLAFLAVGDVASRVQAEYFDVADGAAGSGGEWMLWGMIGIASVVMVAVFPCAVQRIAKTEKMSADDQAEVETWLHGCGVSTHRFFGMRMARWDTGGRLLNAMVAGLVRPGRLLLLSDRLLDELPRGQRLMVVMHELAHVRRFHVPIRMAAILPAWFVSSWTTAMLIDHGWLDTGTGAMVGGVLGLITTIVVLGMVSHWSELDADAAACRLAVTAVRASAAEQDEHPPSDSTRAAANAGMTLEMNTEMNTEMAAELLADALTRVTADHPSSRKISWLHPSLETRLTRLRRISRPLPDPGSDGHTLLF